MPTDPLPLSGAKSLPIHLLRAREAVMAHFKPVLDRHDLTEQQYRVLRVLFAEPNADVGALAQKTGLLAPSASRILKDLENRGLVKRRTCAKDSRRYLSALSGAGEKLVADITPELAPIHAGLRARLGAKRVDELLRLLSDVVEILAAPENRPQ